MKNHLFRCKDVFGKASKYRKLLNATRNDSLCL